SSSATAFSTSRLTTAWGAGPERYQKGAVCLGRPPRNLVQLCRLKLDDPHDARLVALVRIGFRLTDRAEVDVPWVQRVRIHPLDFHLSRSGECAASEERRCRSGCA